MPRPLTLKQRRWVRAYLETGNATEAARRAGYEGNDETLQAIGKENLHKPATKAAIDAADLADEGTAIATRRELRELWTRVAFGEETETVVTKDGDAIEVPAPMAGRLKASELLGRSRGMFVDRAELSGHKGGPILVASLPASAEEAAQRFAALAETIADGKVP